jgi:hypothetical protein
MKRRAFFGELAAITAAVALAPAVRAEAAPADITVAALIAACEAEGHTLYYREWDGTPTFSHFPYGEQPLMDGSTWAEREEALLITEPLSERDRLTFAKGWLVGLHALHPVVPRILPPSPVRQDAGIHTWGSVPSGDSFTVPGTATFIGTAETLT